MTSARQRPKTIGKVTVIGPPVGSGKLRVENARTTHVTTSRSAKIERDEARRAEIAALYGDPEFYIKTKNDVIASLEREDAELVKRIAEAMTEWEEIEKDLAALG